MQADINRIRLFMLSGLWANVAASHLEWWILKTNSKGPGQNLSGTSSSLNGMGLMALEVLKAKKEQEKKNPVGLINVC